MIKKLGFNPSDPKERKKALDIYEDKGFYNQISPGVYSSWAQICVMTKNLYKHEFLDCLQSDPKLHPQTPAKTQPKQQKKAANEFSDYEAFARFLQ